uniref:Uncharacterized protein n=1 Tax=Heterorhabditis bacteriophora TaxID=37862 RepID=A0A1I7XSM2_HETBA
MPAVMPSNLDTIVNAGLHYGFNVRILVPDRICTTVTGDRRWSYLHTNSSIRQKMTVEKSNKQ